MKQRHKRLFLVLGVVAGVSIATALVLNAFRDSMTFFITPSEVLAKTEIPDRRFRIGGIVEAGSVNRDQQSTAVTFEVTDTQSNVVVHYSGILPDLFREGQGVVVEGRLGEGNVVLADRVMARHDENYMPAEAEEAIKRAGGQTSDYLDY